MPNVELDDDTPLLSAMKKERNMKEQREEVIMHYALNLQFWKLARNTPFKGGCLPVRPAESGLDDIR